MKQYFYILLILLIAGINCELSGSTSTIKSIDKHVSDVNSISIDYKIIPSANHTWGYDIYRGGKKVIHQQSIPGMPGNDGFRNKLQAKKAARLVIKKIENGEMPPTVTPEELKELKVI